MPKRIHEALNLTVESVDAPSGRLSLGIISPGWGSSGYYSPKVDPRYTTTEGFPPPLRHPWALRLASPAVAAAVTGEPESSLDSLADEFAPTETPAADAQGDYLVGTPPTCGGTRCYFCPASQ